MKKMILILLLAVFAMPALAHEETVMVAMVDRVPVVRPGRVYVPPTVREFYEYYEIKGFSAGELRDQLSQNGCEWDDGKKYDALTRWHLKWAYETDRDSMSCYPGSFKVTLDIVFRLPKWVRTDDTINPLLDTWENYFHSLKTHENGHRDQAVEAAAELSRSVLKLPTVISCAELDRHVRDATRDLLVQLNADAREYDTATRHGMTQGAVFP